jgi:hypothetical protein
MVGIFGGLVWICLAFVPPECAPVTEASEVFCNRLWTAPLIAMLIGAMSLWWRLRTVVSSGTKSGLLAMAIGFAMMAAGNGGEYWIAYALPHQGDAGALVRSLLWMTALAGWLTALLAAVATGIGLHDPVTGYGRPRWLSVLLVAPLPLTFFFAVLGPGLIGVPVGFLGVFIGIHGLAVRYATVAIPA